MDILKLLVHAVSIISLSFYCQDVWKAIADFVKSQKYEK